jgi:hypothetical protein
MVYVDRLWFVTIWGVGCGYVDYVLEASGWTLRSWRLRVLEALGLGGFRV